VSDRQDDHERLIAVGRVGRPHGLDGAFIVERQSDDPARFRVGAHLVVGGIEAEVVTSRTVGGGRVAIKLDRAVERGATLEVRRGDLPRPEPDTWYVFELEGLHVEDETGAAMGRVTAVHPGTANDNVELDDGTLVPLIDDALVAVDVAGGRIVVRAGFLA